ncbi:MAG: transcription-repair coupling factor [Rickettsiales bacterium]|jgi:transcription-repair coupling factor (superfamily II helicase)|nr:transcription-repair coupling factor [Rickettsiales bacterium]
MSIITIQEHDLLGENPVGENFLQKVLKQQNTLRVGDLIIHIDYGLGRFLGLETLRRNNRENDFLKIEYRDSSSLLIPVENCNLITKYGDSGTDTVLDKLGDASSGSWREKKLQIREKILEYAKTLVEIAAKRELQRSQTFFAESEEFEEFCKQCGFQATPDQERAVEDIRGDMKSGRPMDRLLCGDVGFGKTEVAMRVSFIVACGKNRGQTAIIVPTTLLCRQHLQKFTERFRHTDVKIGAISRFSSPKEAEEIKRKLASGEIDIVIGTHSLLGGGIKFKNLGLTIIDEEQAFGVKQKEQLKELRNNCHILSMSATPIPRTLQMSFSGIRDFSIIATPPPNRINIKTEVLEYDGDRIGEAIAFEVERGGRVFFVTPRIADLREADMRLNSIAPNIPRCFLHGQMNRDYIDQIMNDFYDGKYKILVSTKIIENGLDVSFANTIIVYRANNFGLAQLYQLRGRVGRANTQAYAYLVTKKTEGISAASGKRLCAIESIKTLNSGFAISSRDMEIRGAGNLLGEAQSGHLREVGIELYNQMFREAVKNIKNNVVKGAPEQDFYPEVKFDLSTTIPDEYIGDLNIKMKFYRRIAGIETREEKEKIRKELEDEYGELPPSVENLLGICEIKILCKKLNIGRIEKIKDEIEIFFFKNRFKNSENLINLAARFPERIILRQNGFLYKNFGKGDVFRATINILGELSGVSSI